MLAYYVMDRCDVQREINVAARGLKQPTEQHMLQLKRAARLLKGTADDVVYMPRPEKVTRGIVNLVAWTDTDHAGDIDTRLSQTSFRIEADGVALVDASRMQAFPGVSSGEGEWYGCCTGASELLFLKSIYEFFGFKVSALLRTDSAAARGIGKRLGVGRLKHLDLRSLWLQRVIQ